MITIACVWVHGHVRYSSEYVERLSGMIRRWVASPYRLVCLTDHLAREVPPGIDVIRVPAVRPLPGWWSKVQLFNPRYGLTGRVLYLDLDTLIVSSLNPIIDYPAPFALIPHAGRFQGLHGKSVVKRFNSSVMVWDAPTFSRLYTDWSPTVADRLWGDQDWIGEQLPEAAPMPAAWFPRLSEVLDGPSPDAKVVLCKVPKNHKAARRMPWVNRAWRAA